MGATPGPFDLLGPGMGGEPPGDELEVRLDCWASKRLKAGFWVEDGEELLLARTSPWGHLHSGLARAVLRQHAEGIKCQGGGPPGGAGRLDSHILARGGVVIVQTRVFAVQCTVLARDELAALVFIHGIGAHGAVGLGPRNICITLVNLLSFLYCCPDSESLLL
jgi:hypothetical protein